MTDHVESVSPTVNTSESPGRILLEILAVIVVVPVGLGLGGLTGFLPAGPILGMAFPVALATWLLARRGLNWTDLGLAKPKSWARLGAFILVAILGGIGAYNLGSLISTAAGFAPPDISLLIDYLEGDLVHFLWFLIPIAWLSAGVGEELIARGFLLSRFNDLFGHTRTGAYLAVVAQAALFGLAHSYQGATGVVSVFALALVFGSVYLGMRRNLWATIFAHALVDSVSVTAIFLGYGAALAGQG